MLFTRFVLYRQHKENGLGDSILVSFKNVERWMGKTFYYLTGKYLHMD